MFGSGSLTNETETNNKDPWSPRG